MKKDEWWRKFLIGLVLAILFFGWWLPGFLFINWQFRLYSRHSWSFVIKEFENGWMLSSISDWIFVMTMLLALPLFGGLLYVCWKVRWLALIKRFWKWCQKLWQKLFKKKHKKTVVLAPPVPAVSLQQEKKSGRPQVMNYQGSTGGGATVSVAAASAPTFEMTQNYGTINTGTSNPGGSGSDVSSWNNPENPENVDFANVPLDEIELPKREPLVENIPELFQQAGYRLIPNVQTSLQKLEFLAVAADKVLAVLMDRETGDWLAEEEPFNGEAPLWFSEVDHRVSPVYELRQSVSEIQTKIAASLPNVTVQGLMIEEKGNIINAEEMLPIWQELNITVSRTDVGGTEDLPETSKVVKSVSPAIDSDIEVITKLFKGGE